jgi:hypothetical protein
MSHTDGARGNELQQLRARLADLESMVSALPARFRSARPDANYRHIIQSAHGFTVGTVIRHNGTTWVKSQADTEANAFVGGMVIAVPHSGAFVVGFPGSYVTGLSVTAGINYLSAATAGALTTTAPTIKVPVLMADSTTSGVLIVGAGGSAPPPTEDGTVWCSKSDLSGGEWDFTVDIGRNAASKAGVLTLLSPDASGDAVVIDASLVTASSKKLTIRAIDVCDAGVAKQMLVLGSAPY